MVMMNHDKGANLMRLPNTGIGYPLPSATTPFGTTATETAGQFYHRYHSSAAGTPMFRRSRCVLDRIILGSKTSTGSTVTITIEGKTASDDTTWVTVFTMQIGCDAAAFVPNAVELGIAIDSHSGQKLIGFRAQQDKAEMVTAIVYRIIH